jgi:hypothetical protein
MAPTCDLYMSDISYVGLGFVSFNIPQEGKTNVFFINCFLISSLIFGLSFWTLNMPSPTSFYCHFYAKTLYNIGASIALMICASSKPFFFFNFNHKIQEYEC